MWKPTLQVRSSKSPDATPNTSDYVGSLAFWLILFGALWFPASPFQREMLLVSLVLVIGRDAWALFAWLLATDAERDAFKRDVELEKQLRTDRRRLRMPR